VIAGGRSARIVPCCSRSYSVSGRAVQRDAQRATSACLGGTSAQLIGEDTVVVRGMKMIPADQAWLWTESWLAGEREASEDITAGRVDAFDSADDMFKALHG
jgi:hypothetical protein